MSLTKKSFHKSTFIILLLAIIFFALNKPLLKVLIEEGGPLSLDNPNAISFCNVLFVGNLLAGLVPLAFSGIRQTFKELFSFSGKMFGLLFIIGILNTLYPTLVFYALIYNSVTNVVLILQLETVFFAFLAFFIIRDSIKIYELLGYGFIILGTLVLVFTGKMSNPLFLSLPFLAAFTDAVLSILFKRILMLGCSVTTLLFSIYFFSAAIFFVVAVMLFGIRHFEDLVEPGIWLAMFVYAIFGIVLAESFWLHGIKRASSSLIANVALSFPFFAVFFAYLLVKEIPSIQQIISFAIIIVGMIVSRIGALRARKRVLLITA